MGELTRDQKRSGRKYSIRAQSIDIKRISKSELEIGKLLHPDYRTERPKTRGDCVNSQRPCPFVGCKYNLYLDVSRNGNIKFNFPDLEVWEMKHSCALDIADNVLYEEEMTLEHLGEILNLTRERVRIILLRICAKMKVFV